MISAVGTYLPPWSGVAGARVAGPDEDVVTMAIAAGLQALTAAAHSVDRVVLVSRSLPLLEGGNAAVLLAGLGLSASAEVIEQIGGAPAALDAVAGAPDGTLVIAADCDNDTGAGAAALLVSDGTGRPAMSRSRVHRSLPLRVRTIDGKVHRDDDPRLARERGVSASIDRLGLPGKPVAFAGLQHKQAVPLCEGAPPVLPTTGASSAIFALADLVERGVSGLVVAVEQATMSAITFAPNGLSVIRDEPLPQVVACRTVTPGPEVKIALTAYDRAFEPKLRWEAGQCRVCLMLAFPPRYRCLGCGSEGTATAVSLPRSGRVYSVTTVRVPVPGLGIPYDLAIVELDGAEVRALVTVTDTPAGTVSIGDPGRLVLRRVATRSGVPDYGYAFSPALPL